MYIFLLLPHISDSVKTEQEDLLLKTVTLMNGNTKTTRSFIKTESYEYGNHLLLKWQNFLPIKLLYDEPLISI